jgi:uncharacterized membrane protein
MNRSERIRYVAIALGAVLGLALWCVFAVPARPSAGRAMVYADVGAVIGISICLGIVIRGVFHERASVAWSILVLATVTALFVISYAGFYLEASHFTSECFVL